MNQLCVSALWKILSCICFAGMNTIVRYLSGGSPLAVHDTLPLYTIMFCQNFVGFAFMSLIAAPRHGRQIVSALNADKTLNTLRLCTAGLGLALWNISLQSIPVTQVVALSFGAPILTIIGSVWFLKESFDSKRKLVLLLCISGGFLITRPDLGLMGKSSYGWFALLPILSSLSFAADKVLSRKILIKSSNPEALAWVLLAFMSLICFIPAYGDGKPLTISAPTAFWLAILGLLTAMAHYTFSRAYALAEITFLIPFGTAKLLASATLSFLVFSEAPRTLDMALGVGIMMLSSLLLGITYPGKDRKEDSPKAESTDKFPARVQNA